MKIRRTKWLLVFAVACLTSASTLAQLPGQVGPCAVIPLESEILVGENPVSLLLEDLNGDGNLDILVAHAGSNNLAVLFGGGDATFGPPLPLEMGPIYYDIGNQPNHPNSIGLGDLDGDGKPDAMTANEGSSDLSLLRGQEGGLFLPEVRIPLSEPPQAVAVADVDGDTLDDVVFTGLSTGAVWKLPGLGDGTFGPAEILGDPEPGTSGLKVEDLDDDGFIDFVVTNRDAGTMKVLVGLPDGDYQTFGPYQTGGSPLNLAVGYFNQDGFRDAAVVSGRGGHEISILMGNGDGTFTPTAIFTIGPSPVDIVLGDCNFDAYPDLVVALEGAGVGLMAGFPDGSFHISNLLPTGLSPAAIAVGDLNGDRSDDLVTANFDSNSLTVLLNRPHPNQLPVAEAGPDRVIECTSPQGATVLLDGTASTDPDSTPGTNDAIASFDWYEDHGLATEQFLGSGTGLEVVLPLGSHRISLVTTDLWPEQDVDEAILLVQDSLPPTLEVIPGVLELWPPNHRMVDVPVGWLAQDACSTPAVLLESVISSEPDNGPGDGNTIDDVQDALPGTADGSVMLRAERSGNGNGRTYALRYVATDGVGQSTVATAQVVVPLHGSGGAEPLSLEVGDDGGGTVVHWPAVEGAGSYNVIRGRLEKLRILGDRIDLGPTDCLAEATVATDTLGDPDAALPAVGDGFFYLVEYLTPDFASTYGTVSVDLPRRTTGGGCN